MGLPIGSSLGLTAGSAVLGLSLSGCGGLVAQAPFRLRPDTTHWGSLLGPFDGHVLDQATSNPVAGALVIGSWAYESESWPAVPSSTYSVTTLTASDGSYSLEALPAAHRSLALLRRFTLVVYKAGYIGYRSDIRWDDRTPRSDFAQLANKVRLERLPAGESRAQHLVYLGGGQAVLRAAQAEAIQAALDLAEREKGPADFDGAAESSAKQTSGASPGAVPPSLAAQLLTLADVEAAARSAKPDYIAEPLAANLPGEATAGKYSGIHYRAKGQPESHDAALRIFRESSAAEAEAIWKRVHAQLAMPPLRDGSGRERAVVLPPQRAAHPLLPEVPAMPLPLRDGEGKAYTVLPSRPPAGAGAKAMQALHIDASVRVYDSKQRTYGVALLVRKLGLVLELLCGGDLCPGEEAVDGLLSRVLSRL